RELFRQTGQHQGAGGVDVQSGLWRQSTDIRQQQSIVLLAHAQQQAQFRDVGQRPIGGPIRGLEQQIIVVLGAIHYADLLIEIQPVTQSPGVGSPDIQPSQQTLETLEGNAVQTTFAHQAIQIEATAEILDANPQFAALIQGKGFQRC